jgi:hypothetical protein
LRINLVREKWSCVGLIKIDQNTNHWYPNLVKNSFWFRYPSLSRSASSMNSKMSLSLMWISKYWLNTFFISFNPTNPLYFLSNSVNKSKASSSLPRPKNHFLVIISITSLKLKVYLFSYKLEISSSISFPFILVKAKFPKMDLRCTLEIESLFPA